MQEALYAGIQGVAFIFLSLSITLLISIIMCRNNVYFTLILVILSQNKQNLYKADTSLRRTDYLAPQVSALDRFYCI